MDCIDDDDDTTTMMMMIITIKIIRAQWVWER
jgi:hypothetical protein